MARFVYFFILTWSYDNANNQNANRYYKMITGCSKYKYLHSHRDAYYSYLFFSYLQRKLLTEYTQKT